MAYIFKYASLTHPGAPMHISHLIVRNFRALSDIECDLNRRINVIVGPNGVGKTTILQAIRLVKAIMAPRTQSEAQHVLISLSAASPHFPQRLFLNGLVRDPSRLLEVRCSFHLEDDEINTLRNNIQLVSQSIVSSRLGQGFVNPAALVQFMQSPQGQQAMTSTINEVASALYKLENDQSVTLGLTINSATGQLLPTDALAGPLIAHLDQILPPSSSIFSYFPADRALPMGEVNLQLGGPDAQQQLESHNSQPQTKYMRLKNLIVNSMVLGQNGNKTVQEEFQTIFSGLLRSRRIKEINVNELGLMSIMTEELATGRLIELDSLSSGEKNIALTFLILGNSVSKGGIAIFDEPELHLNPAVSRDLLPFIMDNYSKPRSIQFIMCTHSPEILAGAFSNDDCSLLHLKSSDNISRVGRRALDEYSDALQRLGTSVSESLMYEGTILVEGDDDVIFLETGFPETLKRFKIKDRGGRREVEKTAREIQSLEIKGHKVAPIFLIFDRDDEPTNLKSSTGVKICQWDRRCIDNYLIDIDVITELLKDPGITRSPVSSEGAVHRRLRDLALKQLSTIASRETYDSYNYKNASITKLDAVGDDIPQLAEKFYNRMSAARQSLSTVDKEEWIINFTRSAQHRRNILINTWEAKWREFCDGKKLISDFCKTVDLKMSESSFKARIIQKMRDTSSENWRLVKSKIEEFLSY